MIREDTSAPYVPDSRRHIRSPVLRVCSSPFCLTFGRAFALLTADDTTRAESGSAEAPSSLLIGISCLLSRSARDGFLRAPDRVGAAAPAALLFATAVSRRAMVACWVRNVDAISARAVSCAIRWLRASEDAPELRTDDDPALLLPLIDRSPVLERTVAKFSR